MESEPGEGALIVRKPPPSPLEIPAKLAQQVEHGTSTLPIAATAITGKPGSISAMGPC